MGDKGERALVHLKVLEESHRTLCFDTFGDGTHVQAGQEPHSRYCSEHFNSRKSRKVRRAERLCRDLAPEPPPTRERVSPAPTFEKKTRKIRKKRRHTRVSFSRLSLPKEFSLEIAFVRLRHVEETLSMVSFSTPHRYCTARVELYVVGIRSFRLFPISREPLSDSGTTEKVPTTVYRFVFPCLLVSKVVLFPVLFRSCWDFVWTVPTYRSAVVRGSPFAPFDRPKRSRETCFNHFLKPRRNFQS